MENLYLVVLCLILPFTVAVLEQTVDSNEDIIWKAGSYRNRDVIPMPTSYDPNKKHKRATEESEEEEQKENSKEDEDDEINSKKKTNVEENTTARDDGVEEVDNSYNGEDKSKAFIKNDQGYVDDALLVRSKPSKKSFIRTHFSMPFGTTLPLGYSSKVNHKGSKKNQITRKPLSEMLEGAFKPFLTDANKLTRSRVVKTWGMTWKDPYPNPEIHRDTQGYGRSNLEGTKYRITEEDIDSGLMGRGLGGAKERAQNENLMEQRFSDKMMDESGAEDETKSVRRRKRHVVFLSHLHHYGHHPYHHPYYHYYHHDDYYPQPPLTEPHYVLHPPHAKIFEKSTNNDASTEKEQANSILTNNSTDKPNVEGNKTAPVDNSTEKPAVEEKTNVIPNTTVDKLSDETKKLSEDTRCQTHGRKTQALRRQNAPHDVQDGNQGEQTNKTHESGSYEYKPQYGSIQDGEYDKQSPFDQDGFPWQYQNHDYHHNSFNPHVHAPYKMHEAHDDYKVVHPGHPYEEGPRENSNTSSRSFIKKISSSVDPSRVFLTQRISSKDFINKLFKRKEIPGASEHNTRVSFKKRLLRLFSNIGKISGRHHDDDLSPAEIIDG